MKVWVVTENLKANEDPEVVGLFSSLDECSKGVKAYVARMYGTAKEADSEISSFDATIYTVDEKIDDRRSVEEAERAVFDTKGSRIF